MVECLHPYGIIWLYRLSDHRIKNDDRKHQSDEKYQSCINEIRRSVRSEGAYQP